MGEAGKALGKGTSIRIEGKSFELAPMTLDMVAQFEAWLEDRAWQRVERQRGQCADAIYQERLRATAELIAAGALGFGSEAYARALDSLAGQKQLLFLMLSARQRDVDASIVERIFAEQFEETLAKMAALNNDPKVPGLESPFR